MILDAFRLTGKVAIVTGCDTGLGQGMTVALAQAGCDIIGVNRKVPHDTAAKVEALGRRFFAIQADLSQQAVIADVIAQAVEKFGRIDILVNNAGTIRREDALSFTEKDWDDVMNLNLKSLFFLSQAVPGRKNHQHRVNAVVSGRYSRPVLYGLKERCSGHYPTVSE